MFIAVTFMCLVSGECNFIHDSYLTTRPVCEERNQAVSDLLEADDNVSAYRSICVPIPEERVANG